MQPCTVALHAPGDSTGLLAMVVQVVMLMSDGDETV